MKSLRLRWVIILGILLILGFLVAIAYLNSASNGMLDAGSLSFVQGEPEVNLLPQGLERLSWGSVIAGSLITIVLMFVFNLLGVTIGLTQINPSPRYDSADASDLAIGGLVWIAVSNLIALFMGGWLAAYFAGIPESSDGLLHGIMVWAVSGIFTILFVMTGMGRMMSGLASLLSSGLSLSGSVASSAGQVAGSALQTASSAAGSAGNLTAQTLSIIANGVQSSAQVMGSGLSNLSDSAVENTPDVQDALNYQDLTYSDIKQQVMSLLRQAGQDPEQVEAEVKQTIDDVATATKYAMRNPQQAPDMLEIVLRRVLRRGKSAANEVDRQALVNYMTENSGLSEAEAKEKVKQLEGQFEQVKQQTDQAREIAKQKAEDYRQEAEAKAQEIYNTAQARVEEMQREAETRLQEAAQEAEAQARQAAQDASDAFTKLAAGIAIAMVIGAAAAGLGGFFGAPESLPDIPLDEASNILPEQNSFVNEF